MIRIVLVAGFLILLGNVLVLNYFALRHDEKFKDIALRDAFLANSLKKDGISKAEGDKIVVSSGSADGVSEQECGEKCLTAINNAVEARVSGIKIPTVAVSKNLAQSVGLEKTREWIIPLGGGVVNEINTWTDVYTAQGKIDVSGYPPVKQANFEVVMHIPNGTGELRARLVDSTTPYVYSGQVLSTTSSTGQLLTVPFPIQSGILSFHVQLYSTISQGVLDSARIRLVTQ